MVVNKQIKGGLQYAWYIIYILCAVLFTTLALNCLLIINNFFINPVTEFYWKNDAGEIACKGEILNSPSVSADRIIQFSSNAAVDLNSYSYYNYNELLNSSLQQYFTINGRVNYSNALIDTGVLDDIRNEYVNVSAIVRKIPNIRAEGKNNGRSFWEVEVPITVFRKSNVEEKVRNEILIMTIIRIRPSKYNPNGIAIDGVIARPDYSKDRI